MTASNSPKYLNDATDAIDLNDPTDLIDLNGPNK